MIDPWLKQAHPRPSPGGGRGGPPPPIYLSRFWGAEIRDLHIRRPQPLRVPKIAKVDFSTPSDFSIQSIDQTLGEREDKDTIQAARCRRALFALVPTTQDGGRYRQLRAHHSAWLQSRFCSKHKPHNAQSTTRKAQSTKHKAQSTKHKAQSTSTKHKAVHLSR